MQVFPGLVLAVAVAIPAYFAGRAVPLIGGPVFALALGVLVGLVPRRAGFDRGLKFSSKKVLQLAVVLLGFGMNFMTALRIGGGSLVVMAVTVSAAFGTAWLVSRLLRIGGKAPSLIAIGTAICGASAIAAAAPAMEADDDETAYAISTIFVFNIAAVLIFPAAGRLLGMSDSGFGVWAGTAVNDTSSVVAAGLAFSQAALDTATVVKLTRTLLIVPIVLVLVARTARARARVAHDAGTVPAGTSTRAAAPSTAAASVRSTFPWFVLWFIAASILASTGFVPQVASKILVTSGKLFIVVAMSAIGLGTKPRAFVAAGWRPLALGLACWAAVALSSLAAQAALGRW